METRANHILIGLFTIAGIVGILAFFLAFARVELDRSFAYYDIRFDSVAGLAEAADVRFAGLPVGQVVFIGLSPEDDGTVTVRVEVDADTPVRADSVATVESQGVTGVGFISIGPGSPGAPLDRAGPGEIGEIEAGRSVIQTLAEDAPTLITEALTLIRDVGDLFSGDNRERIDSIIANAEEASRSFSSAISDFADVASSVDDFVTQIDRFNSVLQTVSADFDTVLITADATVAAWGEVAGEVEALITESTGAVREAQATLETVGAYVDEDLEAATAQLSATLARLREDTETLSAGAEAMLAEFTAAGGLAGERLAEIEGTIAALDALVAEGSTAVGAVQTAGEDVSVLVAGAGTELVAESRAGVADTAEAIAAIRADAEERLPGILDDVEAAATTVARAAAGIEADLTGATGELEGLVAGAEGALAQASQTFAEANDTLAAIERALATGEETLAAATGTFTQAEALIATDLAPLAADLAETLGGLDAAVAQVAEDIPGISSSLSEAATAAEQAFARVAATVDQASPAVQSFATAALPEYTAFAREARTLTQSLERLVRQIERDPARFFLNSDAPEFRR